MTTFSVEGLVQWSDDDDEAFLQVDGARNVEPHLRDLPVLLWPGAVFPQGKRVRITVEELDGD